MPSWQSGALPDKDLNHMKLIIKAHSARHGVSKREVDTFLSGNFLTLRTGKGRYMKGRYKLIGKSNRFLALIVDKKAPRVFDLVSARKATDKEKSLYRESFR